MRFRLGLLLITALPVTLPAATSYNLGAITLDVLIPGNGPAAPGVNVFHIHNFTGDPGSGGSALAPDFPVYSPLTLTNSQLTVVVGGVPSVIQLGTIVAGAFTPPAALQFPETTQFDSATFTATLSTTSLLLSNSQTVVVGSAQVTASIVPSGPYLQRGADFALITATVPTPLGITKSHTGNFTQGQINATYTVTVSNPPGGNATSGTVTMTETVPAGMTLVSMAGTGWVCASTTCTRSNALAAGSSYPPITVTVNVASGAISPLVNAVSVSGGGFGGGNTTDPTVLNPVLNITKTHTGSFALGQINAAYTVTVSNQTGAGATTGTVTVTDTVPAGMTLQSMAGTGWTCASGANTCTRNNALAGGASYPPITVTVNIAANAVFPLINSVGVSGGGSASATATDSTASSCTYSLSGTSAFAWPAANGSAAIATSAGCAWSAASNSPWLHITSTANGTGPAQVTFSVEANATVNQRAGSLQIAGQAFTILQGGNIAPTGSGMRFVPVTPCRIADTRLAAGALGGPNLVAAVIRSFAIQGVCGIPASAQAYSLNLTVVPMGSLGFLSVWPAGQPQPVVSTLNSGDGRVKANAAIVPAGTGGAITLFASHATHAIVDINGYFVPASGNANLQYYPLTPCRIADTRSGTGTFAGPALAPGTTRTFPLLSSVCGIPGTAQAYALNMTVVPSGPLGFLSAWPAGGPQPGSSTLNAPTGAITANAAIVPAGAGGAIAVIATHATNLIIDINGYFAPPGAGGMQFYSAIPCRIADTRGATGHFAGPQMAASARRDFVVAASVCGVPASAGAYSLNATVVPPAGLGFLSLWGAGGQPTVSTLNSPDGSIVANAALVPAASTGSVSAIVSHATHLILDINGFFQ